MKLIHLFKNLIHACFVAARRNKYESSKKLKYLKILDNKGNLFSMQHLILEILATKFTKSRIFGFGFWTSLLDLDFFQSSAITRQKIPVTKSPEDIISRDKISRNKISRLQNLSMTESSATKSPVIQITHFSLVRGGAAPPTPQPKQEPKRMMKYLI